MIQLNYNNVECDEHGDKVKSVMSSPNIYISFPCCHSMRMSVLFGGVDMLQIYMHKYQYKNAHMKYKNCHYLKGLFDGVEKIGYSIMKKKKFGRGEK